MASISVSLNVFSGMGGSDVLPDESGAVFISPAVKEFNSNTILISSVRVASDSSETYPGHVQSISLLMTNTISMVTQSYANTYFGI